MANFFKKLNLGIVREAVTRARTRIYGQSQLIGISAILVLVSFVLLAFIAPFAVKMPRIIQAVFGFLPFIFLIAGIGVAIFTLVKLGKEGSKESEPLQISGTIAKTAIEAALSEAEDAGLKSIGSREYGDCLSGKIGDFPFAIIKGIEQTFAIIRLKQAANCFIMLAPFSLPWPNILPTDKPLTPLTPPENLPAQAWTFDDLKSRERAQAQLNAFGSSLLMSMAGGEVPYLYLNGRNLVMAWRNCDIGSACLITHEIAKTLR